MTRPTDPHARAAADLRAVLAKAAEAAIKELKREARKAAAEVRARARLAGLL